MSRIWIALAVLTLIVATAVAIGVTQGPDSPQLATKPHTTRSAEPRVYRLEADHATYASVDEARADSDVVVIGTVLSHETAPGESPGVDGAGDPLPAVPHTNYTVTVQTVLKGALAAGSTIVVSLSGGTTDKGRFVLDGGPVLDDGDQHMFFLKTGDDDLWYPLAGGAAIADRQPDGSFTLPAEATGTAPLAVTPADVPHPPPSNASPAPPPAPSPLVDRVPPRVRVRLLAHQRRGAVLRDGLRLTVTCSEPCTASGRLALGSRIAARLHLARPGRTAVVAIARSTTTGTLVLRFSTKAGQQLRDLARVALRLSLDAVDASGNRTRLARTIKLTRTGPHLAR